MYSDDELVLELLFSRLSWPSPLVRERACSQIAQLLRSSDNRATVESGLLRWIARQRLESLAVVGLLVFCKASDLGAEIPSKSALVASVSSPSLLSMLLLNDLLGEEGHSEGDLPHAADRPADFVPDAFFETQRDKMIPGIFRERAAEIEQFCLVPFEKQWAYEWTSLHAEHGTPPTVPEVRFWWHDRHRRMMGIDVTESEYYRSAYLRAIAWALEAGALNGPSADRLASELCPINLDLWRVEPSDLPIWWSPGDSAETSSLETKPGEMLERIRAVLLHGDGLEGKWILAEATGSFREGDVYYDLQVRGVVQASVGTSVPPVKEFHEGALHSVVRPSTRVPLLRLEGPIPEEPIEDWQYRRDDWLGWPLACPIDHLGILRWQPWRLERAIWAPAPWLSEDKYSVTATSAQLEYRDEGGLFAKWSDWLDNYAELSDTSMPVMSGQALLLDRERAEAAAVNLKGTIAWTIQWTRVHRPDRHGDKIERSKEYFAVGTTNIIRA